MQAQAPHAPVEDVVRPDRDLDALCKRLDALTHQLGRLVNHVEAARPTAGQPAGAGSLDSAIAEIAERQRMLAQVDLPGPSMFPPPAAAELSAAPAPALSAPLASAPTANAAAANAPDLSGLEQQLKFITTQLEILRSPCRADELVAELRQELAGIAKMLDSLVPRSAFDVLEREVRSLDARLDVSRDATADAAALASVEQGLAEIRDALRGLAPVELHQAVQTLSEKIDQVTANGADPATLHQLDNAINALRSIVAQVASGDALAALVKEVRALGDKIEHGAAGAPAAAMNAADRELLIALEKEVGGIALTLNKQAAAPAPAIEPLIEQIVEKLDRFDLFAKDEAALEPIKQQIDSLGDKIDRLRPASAEPATLAPLEAQLGHLSKTIERMTPPASEWPALAAVEDRIRVLAAKLDRIADNPLMRTDVSPLEQQIAQLSDRIGVSEARLGTLQVIEQGMVGIIAKLDEMQRAGGAERRLAAPSAEQDAPARREAEPAERIAFACDRRNDGRPDRMRAAPLHDSAEGDGRQAAVAAPAEEEPQIEERWTPPPKAEPMASPPASLPAISNRAPAAASPPAPVSDRETPSAGEPSLPPDAPIEPGAGPPRMRGGRSAAERIAASQAVLGPVPADRSAGPAARANFIVAARRAAQAASEQHGQMAADAAAAEDAAPGAAGKRLAKRVKSLFVSSSLILIAFGVAGIALSSLDFFGLRAPRTAEQPLPPAATRIVVPHKPLAGPPPVAEARPAGPVPTISAIASSPAAGEHGDKTGAASPVPTTVKSVVPAPARQEDGGPAARSPAVASADITGSLPQLPDNARPAPHPARASTPSKGPPWSDPLPAAIATKALNAGAAARNPAAAYEIAIRYAEGRGVSADMAAAATWFARAAEGGIAPAQFRLGSMYEKGIGVKKDLAEARRLYLAAAARGNANAMHNIAVLYAEGIDGKPDFAMAADWFRKAASYGVADSQYNLAILYARGIGVDQNFAESFKWFDVAAQKGDKDAARKRDDIGARLDPQTLAAARLAASVFVPLSQPDEATTVQAPPGGWDDVAVTPGKPKSRARYQSQQSAQL